MIALEVILDFIASSVDNGFDDETGLFVSVRRDGDTLVVEAERPDSSERSLYTLARPA